MNNTESILNRFNQLEKGLSLTPVWHGTRVLSVLMKGYLDTINSEDFKLILKNLAEETGNAVLVFDMTGLSYISSMGIGFFISLIREYPPDRKTICFLGMNDAVAGVFRTLGFLDFITRIESLDEIGKA